MIRRPFSKCAAFWRTGSLASPDGGRLNDLDLPALGQWRDRNLVKGAAGADTFPGHGAEALVADFELGPLACHRAANVLARNDG
jgi:hypothetical protein